MGELQRTAVSLRFGGDDLNPDEITRKLGATPSTGARKGAIRLTPKGTEMVARSGIWVLKAAPLSPGDLDRQIAMLLATLSDDLAVWRDIAHRYNGNIFAGLFLASFNEGTSLRPQTLSMLGSRGLALGLDIYGSGEQD